MNYVDWEDVWLINRHYKPGQVKNKNALPASLTRMIQYSSNEGDLVCDLFLGGFSRVKAAIGLNWKVIGFEVSTEIFGVKTEEIASLQPVLCFPRSGPL